MLCNAIQSIKSKFLALVDQKTNILRADLNNIQGVLSTLTGHVTELDHWRCLLNITELMKQMKSLEKENTYQKEKAEEAENRHRSPNFSFIKQREEKDMI